MIQVSEGIYRGPNLQDWTEFWRRDVKTVLNLQTSTQEILWGDPNIELRECARMGIYLYDMAMSGIFPPKEIDVRFAVTVLMKAEKPIYVHCRAGRERTGYVVAAYRMIAEGWTFEDAEAEWLKMGCRQPTNWLWRNSLKKFYNGTR